MPAALVMPRILIKLLLIGVFLGCLARMPYSYYQLTRFVALAGFVVLFVLDYRDKRYVGAVLSGMGVVLFNPFFKATFKREVWQVIDVWMAGVLLVWVVVELIQVSARGKGGM